MPAVGLLIPSIQERDPFELMRELSRFGRIDRIYWNGRHLYAEFGDHRDAEDVIRKFKFNGVVVVEPPLDFPETEIEELLVDRDEEEQEDEDEDEEREEHTIVGQEGAQLRVVVPQGSSAEEIVDTFANFGPIQDYNYYRPRNIVTLWFQDPRDAADAVRGLARKYNIKG